MKRRNFIKALATACAVPVVAAKAIASHKKKGLLLDLYPGAIYAYSTRKLTSADIPHDPRVLHYDQSGNGNHIFLKPEDAPLHKHHTSV